MMNRYIVVNREHRREFCEERAICFQNRSDKKVMIERVKDEGTGETKKDDILQGFQGQLDNHTQDPFGLMDGCHFCQL